MLFKVLLFNTFLSVLHKKVLLKATKTWTKKVINKVLLIKLNKKTRTKKLQKKFTKHLFIFLKTEEKASATLFVVLLCCASALCLCTVPFQCSMCCLTVPLHCAAALCWTVPLHCTELNANKSAFFANYQKCPKSYFPKKKCQNALPGDQNLCARIQLL